MLNALIKRRLSEITPYHCELHQVYEAHFLQHTVQNDNTPDANGRSPSESKCLLRKVFAVLSKAEQMVVVAEKNRRCS